MGFSGSSLGFRGEGLGLKALGQGLPSSEVASGLSGFRI